MTGPSVGRNFTIIGGATKNIPADLRARLPEIDWCCVAGFRDVLVHLYFDVDVDLMWQIITERIGTLAAAVEAFLNAM